MLWPRPWPVFWRTSESFPPPRREIPADLRGSGGGGDRTRVRGRTGQNLYKRSPPLSLTRRPEADALPTGQPSFDVALWAIGSPSAPSPLLAPLPEPRAQFGATSLPNYLGSECEIVLRTCIVAGGFTRPTGDLGLQLCRRTDHVETRSPPYVWHEF